MYPAVLGRLDIEVVAVEALELPPTFRRGDANDDGKVDISDPLLTLGCKFLGERCPVCRDAADANDDGSVDISDAVYSLNFLFRGGAGPPPPGPLRCAQDPTDDFLPPCASSFCGTREDVEEFPPPIEANC